MSHEPMLDWQWPEATDWQAWQSRPLPARQVIADGTFDTRPVKAGEWIVRLGPFFYRAHDGDRTTDRHPLYLILSDLEFRQHFQPRPDYEVTR